VTDQSMAAYCPDLKPSLIQLLAMMRKGSQARRQAGQAHNTVINEARTKEMGHRGKEEEEKEGRTERRNDVLREGGRREEKKVESRGSVRHEERN